jgi:predicted DNA binding CopG/RHH family protein
MRTSTNFRLTEEAVRLLHALAEAKGLSYTSLIEMMLRDTAKREGIK